MGEQEGAEGAACSAKVVVAPPEQYDFAAEALVADAEGGKVAHASEGQAGNEGDAQPRCCRAQCRVGLCPIKRDVGAESSLAASIQGSGPQFVADWKENERLLAQIGHRHPRLSSKWVFAADGDHQFFAEQAGNFEAGIFLTGWGWARAGDDRKIETTLLHHALQTLRSSLVELQFDSWVLAVELGESARQQVAANRRGRTNRHPATRLPLPLTDCLLCLGDQGEDAAGIGQQGFTRRSKASQPPTPLEQWHPQPRLQRTHLLAERRLGQPQFLTRPREAAQPGDRLKVAQVMQFHRSSHLRSTVEKMAQL